MKIHKAEIEKKRGWDGKGKEYQKGKNVRAQAKKRKGEKKKRKAKSPLPREGAVSRRNGSMAVFQAAIPTAR